jgi:hypothetical protein
MAQDAVSPRGRGVRAGGFDQLTMAQLSQRHLHRAFRQTCSFCDRAQALRDWSPILSFTLPIKVEINEKGPRLLIVPDQITHQNIQNVVVDRDAFAVTWHLSDFKQLYRLKDSDFFA